MGHAHETAEPIICFKTVGLIAMPDDHLGEKLRRQKSDVLGEEAEDHPVEKLGHRMRIETTLPQALRDVAETGCGLFSNRAVGGAWSELVRLKEKGTATPRDRDRAIAPSATRCTFGGASVKLTWISRSRVSHVTSSGGLSSAYVRQELFVSLARLARAPLYSKAKKPRFHTSAQPPPPPCLAAPFSKVKVSPVASSSAGVGGRPDRRDRESAAGRGGSLRKDQQQTI